MNPFTAALILVMLPPCDDAIPASTDPVTFQALKDTAHLLDLWARPGHWGSDYASEVRWTQTAFRACHDAPHVGDVHRLPPLELIEARIAFSEAHECFLLDLSWQRFYDRERIDARMAETRRLRHAWELMRTARGINETWDLRRRREALKALREYVGPEAYFAGRWPEWVPVP